MLEWLAQYGLFLAKTITIIIGILVVLASAFALSQRNKQVAGTIVIENLSDKVKSLKQAVQHKIVINKAEKKALCKTEKEAAKQDKINAKKMGEDKPRLFLIRFEGDMRASQVNALRESVNALLLAANPKDKVLVLIDSAGGFVHTYGLAASQIKRIRDQGLHLVVSIDKVAASGGYLMACVAHEIIAAPFAIIGSIGVVGQLPNFNRLLTKHHIDFEQHTAGKYKRTLTVFGKNTQAARQKFQEDIEQTHQLFKQFIIQHRAVVQIEQVATGEHWHALDALKYQLIDAIQTSDDYLLNQYQTHHIFEISYIEKKNMKEKLANCLHHVLDTVSSGFQGMRGCS
ncbi:MAG: protease SohB [Gammaproteobacteria bacterium]|jgi:serine protease SohB